MMDNEKDSYRHTWTYDLDGTRSGKWARLRLWLCPVGS